MTFPATVLPLHVEINPTGGATPSSWVDITDYVRRDDGITITSGKMDKAQVVQAGTAPFKLRNTDNRWSPNNPLGPYWPNLGRNTPCRIWVEQASTYLACPDVVGSYATTPDAAALDITGDIDIRVDATIWSWHDTMDLAAKWNTTGGQRSWLLTMSSGKIRLWWSENGTILYNAISTQSVAFPAGHRMAIRVTLDVNNGAGGNTATFYTSDTIDGTWTQLGDAVVTAGTTSLFSGTDALYLGAAHPTGTSLPIGRIHAFEVRDGIDGTEVANPVFTGLTRGDTGLTDAAGRVWTLAGSAEITDRVDLHHGELSVQPDADTSGRDKIARVTSSGILRRLGQGQKRLRSVLRRALPEVSGLVAYWPMEDGADATRVAAGIAGVQPAVFAGSPVFGYSSAFEASDPIVKVNGARFTGVVPGYTSTGVIQVRFLVDIESGGLTNGDRIIQVYTSGTVSHVDLHWGTGGTLYLTTYDRDGAVLDTDVGAAFGADDVSWRVEVKLFQDGADLDWQINALAPGASQGGISGTFAGRSIGRCTKVVVCPNRNFTDVSVGHLTVQTASDNLSDLDDELNAYRGEAASSRLIRLCAEEGLTLRYYGRGDGIPGTGLGAQTSDTLLNLLRDIEAAEGGTLYEPADCLGIGYLTRSYRLRRPADITLSPGDMSAQPVPAFDDIGVRNDITLTRSGGSEYRVVDETSRMSVLDPPNGVGQYLGDQTVNLETDTQIADHAWWRLHLGTWDGPRCPRIEIQRSRSAISGDAALDQRILDAHLLDRVDLTGLSPWVSYDDVQQHIVGVTHQLSNFEHRITWRCEPAEPWRAGRYDESDSRYDTAGSDLAVSLESTSTAFDGSACRSYTATDVTGDIDIRVKCSLADWTPSARTTLAGKYLGTGNQRSWRLQVISAADGTVGCLRLYWSNNGTASLSATSTVATGITDGAVKWVRCTLDVNNGAAGNDVKFYLSDDGANWTQLGSTVTQGFTTAIFDSTTMYQLGASDATSMLYPLTGSIYRVIVLDGIDGTDISLPVDPADWTDGYSGTGTGHTTTSDVTASTVAVDTTTGPLWTTDAGALPIDLKISGEVVRVTACSGTTSPQTMTMTRAVNGVLKEHAAGTAVALAAPVYYAI